MPSRASSASSTITESLDASRGTPYIFGSTYPTPSRRHRSSSSLSGSYYPAVQGPRTSSRSRRPSFASSQRSQNLMPVASQPPEPKRDVSAHVTSSSRSHAHRSSFSQKRIPSPSVSKVPSDDSSRVDMESLMNENEVLRQRIRELELELSVQKDQSKS